MLNKYDKKLNRVLIGVFSMALICFSVCLVPVSSARAELKVDITAGTTEPISIAFQKFETDKQISNKDADILRNIVEKDLKSSGLFRIISHDAFPEYVKLGDMPKFASWAAIKTGVLVQTKIIKQGKDKYKLEFYAWDINGKEQIEAQSLIASKKSQRRLAHIMADTVYERLTGEGGYFDTQIVFVAETGKMEKRRKRLAIIDQDGFGFRYISDGNTIVMSPYFSPNMQTIIFLSYQNDDPMVWTLDMNTGAQKRLGKFGGMNFSPRFSPDGGRVAISLVNDRGITNICEYNIETRELRQLTFGTAIDTSPSYSPDGKFIAFNSNRSGSQQIHMIDLETMVEKRLTYGSGKYATPAYSPDGKLIAFTKIADDTFYIGIMNPAGRNEKILTGAWFTESPSWAPGSRRLVYYETQRVEDDDNERFSYIRSVDITGQNVYDIELPRGVSGTHPTWSPKLP